MKALRRVLVNALLSAILIGLLGAYFVAGILPQGWSVPGATHPAGVALSSASVSAPGWSYFYTPAQRDYLAYNSAHYVAQVAPTWNYYGPDGAVRPGLQFRLASRVRATLEARYEEEDGVSATVYDLVFEGAYTISAPITLSAVLEMFFPFPANLETLHQVRFLADGEEDPFAQYSTAGIQWRHWLDSGRAHRLEVRYRASGAGSFAYGLPRGDRGDVDAVIEVHGLTGSAVPRSSLPATGIDAVEGGERLAWDYRGLIADRDIELNLPARLSFIQQVAQFQSGFRDLARLVPLLVGGFLAALAGLLYLGGVHLRVETYLLAGCGLALFYPGLTFLSGLLGVVPAAALALSVTGGVLLLFLGLAAGWRETWLRVGVLLAIFLGLFSLGMLTAWRGLFLTAGGLALVGTLMLAYVRRPAPVTVHAAVCRGEGPAQPEGTAPGSGDTLEGASPAPRGWHCPYCSRQLADDQAFCPGCGRATRNLRRCPACGHEQLVLEEGPAYCLRCGREIAG